MDLFIGCSRLNTDKHSSAAQFSVNSNQSSCIDVPYPPGPEWQVFADETQALVSYVC